MRIVARDCSPLAPQPTAAPTATPSPNIKFWADSTTIKAGQCTTLRWDVTNVREVYVLSLIHISEPTRPY